MYVCMWLQMPMDARGLDTPQPPPRPRVPGACELPSASTGNPTQVLCKTSLCSWLVSRLSSFSF